MTLSLDSIRQRLADRTARDFDHPERERFVPSAVLLPLFEAEGDLHVLFTKRTQSVRHHKGQISFPGGRLDPEDTSLRDCALRETEEEIGLPQDRVEILGRLDETPVITFYRITPFVGLIPHPFEFRPSPGEIETLLTFPLRLFLEPERHSMTVNPFMGREYPIHFYHVGEEAVWGATGRILTNFLQACFDYTPPKYAEFLEQRSMLPGPG